VALRRTPTAASNTAVARGRVLWTFAQNKDVVEVVVVGGAAGGEEEVLIVVCWS
jgi:hypothetical protein